MGRTGRRVAKPGTVQCSQPGCGQPAGAFSLRVVALMVPLVGGGRWVEGVGDKMGRMTVTGAGGQVGRGCGAGDSSQCGVR